MMLKRQVVQQVQRACYGTVAPASSTQILPHSVSTPPQYVLATLRSFPSLEPHKVFPVANEFLNTPLRRDILWRAAVHEADCARVGASNPPGRGDLGFSRRKLMPQKGNGKARVGDANSPIRINGARALARTAPNDFSTKLPAKLYANAFRVALSDFYRRGSLFIIGGNAEQEQQTATETFDFNIATNDYHAIDAFIDSHKLENLNLLFIAADLSKVETLTNAIKHHRSKRLTVANPDDLEVRQVLKANRIYVEQAALEKLATLYAKDL